MDSYQHVPSLESTKPPASMSSAETRTMSTDVTKPSSHTVPPAMGYQHGSQNGAKPTNTALNVSTATKSALLERITSTNNPMTSGLLVQNSMLAGHLTGLIPISRNSSAIAAGSLGSNVLRQGQLMPGAGSELQTLYLTQRHQTVAPELWSVVDVCHFLKYNDCSSYVEIFHRKVS